MKRPSQFKLPDPKRPKRNGFPPKPVVKFPARSKNADGSNNGASSSESRTESSQTGSRPSMPNTRVVRTLPRVTLSRPGMPSMRQHSLQPTRRTLPVQRHPAQKAVRKTTLSIPSLQRVPLTNPYSQKPTPTLSGTPSFSGKIANPPSPYNGARPTNPYSRNVNPSSIYNGTRPSKPTFRSAPTLSRNGSIPSQRFSAPNLSRNGSIQQRLSAPNASRNGIMPQRFPAPNTSRNGIIPQGFPVPTISMPQKRTPLNQSQLIDNAVRSPLARNNTGARKSQNSPRAARKSRNPVYMHSKLPTRRRISPNKFPRRFSYQTQRGSVENSVPLGRIGPAHKDITFESLGVPPLKADVPRCDVCFHIADRNGIVDLPWSLSCSSCYCRAHPLCYGFAPDDPEYLRLQSSEFIRRKWVCQYCREGEFTKRTPCKICGSNHRGVFKPVEGGGWAHLSCALWIPETYIINAYTMGPIYGVDSIHPARTKLVCVYCERPGNMIQCHSAKCATAFHIQCAFRKDPRLLPAVNIYDKNVCGFCMRHHPFQDRNKAVCQIAEEPEETKERIPGIELKDMQCSRYSLEFKSDSSLRRHMKLCSAQSAKSRKINKIVKFHTQSVPEVESGAKSAQTLSCPICEAKFMPGNANFEKHLKAHQEEEVFANGERFLPYITIRQSAVESLIHAVEERCRPQRKIKLVIGSRTEHKLKLSKLKLWKRKDGDDTDAPPKSQCKTQ